MKRRVLKVSQRPMLSRRMAAPLHADDRGSPLTNVSPNPPSTLAQHMYVGSAENL